jgi:putative membrane protein
MLSRSSVRSDPGSAPEVPHDLLPLLDRWYSFLPWLLVAVVIWRRHGARVALAVLLGGWAIAFLAEWGSVSGLGIPFGVYHYRLAGLNRDWLIAGVPLFDSLSFTWLAYCAYTVVGALGARGPARLLLGALLLVGVDVVVDPVALRGAHWFLGSIYRYPPGSGVWFGVSALNYVGWFVVGLLLVAWLRIWLGETRPGPSLSLGLCLILLAGVLLQSTVLALLLGVGPAALAAVGVILLCLLGARFLREAGGPPPSLLIVACALNSEAAAARSALPMRWERSRTAWGIRWVSPGSPVEVWVTGMGQEAASRAAHAAPRGSVVLVAGIAGGCAPGWELGMVGVATRVLSPAGAWTPLDSGANRDLLLGGVGRPCGLASVAAIADGPEQRRELVRLGAELVEMETAAWIESLGPSVVAVRVVLDTPGQPLGAAGALLVLGGRGPSMVLLTRLLLRHPGALPSLLAVGRRQRLAARALTEALRKSRSLIPGPWGPPPAARRARAVGRAGLD